MAEFFPIRSSAPREPDRRPRPIPANVKTVIHLMIWGDDATPDALPLDLIAACTVVGVKPFVMRRYLDRPNVIAHLRAEQRKFREAICCGNTAALRRVRDGSQNAMAVVASVRALGDLQAEEAGRASAPSSRGNDSNRTSDATTDADRHHTDGYARCIFPYSSQSGRMTRKGAVCLGKRRKINSWSNCRPPP